MKKEQYKSPASKVVEMKTQGVLCQSGETCFFLMDLGDYENGGDPFAVQ